MASVAERCQTCQETASNAHFAARIVSAEVVLLASASVIEFVENNVLPRENQCLWPIVSLDRSRERSSTGCARGWCFHPDYLLHDFL